jgi:sterol desaturase/sphingolipid hydroxylase (fatty acid hydroxylase superfamily)
VGEWQAWGVALARAVWTIYWPLLVLVGIATLIERVAPVEPMRPRALLFNLVWHACFLAIFVALSWSAWGAMVAALEHWVGAPLIALSPASGWHLAAQIALVLLVFDFLAYWLHRAQHAVPVFWAVHRMHHDEQHLHAATGIRQQWLQLVFAQLVLGVPLAWLFGPLALHPAVYWLPVGVSVFQHMNLRLPLGRVTPLLMGPQLHRLHHATEARIYNTNYATLLPLWDMLFHTYRAPAPGEFGATGIAGAAPTASLARALVLPVAEWWRMAYVSPTDGQKSAAGKRDAVVRARRR